MSVWGHLWNLSISVRALPPNSSPSKRWGEGKPVVHGAGFPARSTTYRLKSKEKRSQSRITLVAGYDVLTEKIQQPF